MEKCEICGSHNIHRKQPYDMNPAVYFGHGDRTLCEDHWQERNVYWTYAAIDACEEWDKNNPQKYNE